MLGELAEGILRRPAITLATLVAAIAVAGVIAAGASSSLPVLGSLHADEGAPRPVELVFVVEGREDVDSPVYSTALEVMVAGLASDPAVAEVRRGPVGADDQTTALGIVLASDSARERELAAARLEQSVDPGPLRLTAGGEAKGAYDLRSRIEGDLDPLVAAALVAVVALLLFVVGGWRLLVAGGLASAAGILAGASALRLLSGAIELSAAGIAVAVVAGLVCGIEATTTLYARVQARARREELPLALRMVIGGAGSRLALASGVAALAAFCLLANDVPLSRSAAIAAAAAVLAATGGAIVAVPVVLALSPPRWARKPAGPGMRIRLRRIPRRGLTTVLAAVLVVGVLGALATLALPALDSEPVAYAAKDDYFVGDEAEALLRHRFDGPPGEGLGAAFSPTVPDDLMLRLGIAAALAALVVSAVSLWLERSLFVALALGLAAVLPAAAAVGMTELWSDYPQASAILLAASILTAVSAFRCIGAAGLLRRLPLGRRDVLRLARATLPGAATASLAGCAVCFALSWVTDVRPLQQLVLAVSFGLALDFFAIRCLLVPALTRLRRPG